jgi:outer membrane protein assembly factor BamB
VRGAIATTASGDIVVPCEDGSLYAFNAQGKLLWKSTQTLLGHDRWTFRTGAPVNSSP